MAAALGASATAEVTTGWPARAASLRGALARLSDAAMVVLTDGQETDNMGMLVLAAQFITADRLREIDRMAGGTVYLALTDRRCDELGLDLVPDRDASLVFAPVTATIAARDGIVTGISLAEHAHTIRVAISPASGPRDIRLGGHVQPLRARPLGVVERPGLTEAAVDLMTLCGLTPAAAFAEIRLEDGTAAQGAALSDYAAAHSVPIVSVADVVEFRLHCERLVERVVDTRLPTSSGEFAAVGYRSMTNDRAHLALVKGSIEGAEDVLTYIHFGCWAGDVFGSCLCNCRASLQAALAAVASAPAAAIVHLSDPEPDRHLRGHRESRRDDWLGAQILADLGVGSVTLLLDASAPVPEIDGYGFSVRARQTLKVAPRGRTLRP